MKSTKLNINKSKKRFSFLQNSKNQKIFGTIILLFSMLMIIAFISYVFTWKIDDSILSKENYTIFNNETKNQIGGLGAQIGYRFIKLWFGVTALLIPITTLIIALNILGFKKFKIRKIIFNTILALIVLPVFISHFLGGVIAAGGLGIFTNNLLIQAIGNIGTSLILITFILLYLIIVFEINKDAFQKLVHKIKKCQSST